MSNIYGQLKTQNGNTYQLPNKVNLIGRAQSCIIIVKHPSVSKEHAFIEFEGQNVAFIKDLNSLNGVYLNGQRLQKGQQQNLKTGDQISFGKDETIFEFYSFNFQQQTKQSQILVQQFPQQQASNNNFPVIQINPNNNAKSIVKEKDYRISVTDYIRRSETPNKSIKNEFVPNKFQSDGPQFGIESLRKPLIQSNQIINQASQQQQQQNNQPFQSSQHQQNYQQVQENQNTQQQNTNNYIGDEFQKIEIQYNEKILNLKDQILQKENRIQELVGDLEKSKQDNGKQQAKIQALELYLSEQQQKIDKLTDDSFDNRKLLDEVFKQDWGKKIHENELELTNLRKLLIYKDQELDHLRKNLGKHFSNCKDYDHNYNHHLQFVETQTSEISNCRKQIIEYENRNNECQKKWTSLIKENLEKEEKIKGLKMQIERQLDTFQTNIAESDKRINVYNMKILKIMEQSEDAQYEAAEFLVEQMALIQEERRNISIENENLHSQIQDLISEIERMKNDIEQYESMFDLSESASTRNINTASNTISKLKQRCEELSDLINDLKVKGGVPKIIQLQELLENLEKAYEQEKQKNKQMAKNAKEDGKSNKNKSQADDSNMVDFFTQLIQEKDKEISFLLEENEKLRNQEKNYLADIENFKHKLNKVTNQNPSKNIINSQQSIPQNKNVIFQNDESQNVEYIQNLYNRNYERMQNNNQENELLFPVKDSNYD